MSTIDAVEILSKLVAFRSLSGQSNHDIADYVETFAKSLGAAIHRFPSVDGTRTSLFITLGPMVPGGIVLSGHMDVVPTGNQSWTSDPFALRQANGRLFGRGTVDMKGFLALALALAASTSVAKLTKPLHLAFSYDEEISCEGVRPIVSHIQKFVPTPLAVIVGEPTEMQIVGAHKGALDWTIEVLGKAAHSSLPHLGANAIHAAARLICEVEEISREFAEQPSQNAELYDVPHPTVTVGVIEGGTAGNVIAARCSFQMEARTLEPGQAAMILERISTLAREVVLPQLRATASDSEIRITERFDIPPLVREASSAAEQLVSHVSSSPNVKAVSYATEAGFFQAAGLPTVVFGPGSISQAHQVDEFIDETEFKAGERALVQIAQTLF
ncbi:acetylornithine deacetylase [Rhizobium leguminosarum]|uniref:acetylornithine deacetylase n=1 Tax=Rhizobium leguminosarum TaxID=384 RepID=UPI001C9184B0|nr:acetylornithine deacetylase [Rhizobium leguminosarum]MBY2915383.1 acetylornithine deacetylase [Rhizobium leguminosarum]MBY2970921.1 acetylornithine deacetylase [Rhizobium leguminosarum]MBY2977988.1 acetylornithine deacetylase [Rhizobium leguminosarum]MBY3006538.1 acetylornithine deacetylase [Rhizobium leguminosarum]